MSTLKDHQIAELVNAIRSDLTQKFPELNRYGPLRETIANTVLKWVEKHELRGSYRCQIQKI